MTISTDHLTAWIADFKRRHGLADLLLAADDHLVEERAELAEEYLKAHVPAKFRDALPTAPEVQNWAAQVIRTAVTESQKHGRIATVHQGPSLLLLGPTGSGKTYEAYGALRAISACGLHSPWLVVAAPDLYAEMGPRHGVDTETVFAKVAQAPILVLDDLGALPENTSPWEAAQAEKINYRLVNRRYERMLPTLFTSNVPPKDIKDRPGLTTMLGDRVASRLVEMTERVVLRGPDRRKAT